MLLRVAIAQVNLLVGAIESNADIIIDYAHRARQQFQADVVVFPELSLSSYPLEDLLLRPELEARIKLAAEKIKSSVTNIDVLFGLPLHKQNKIYNAAMWCRKGDIVQLAYKNYLPNYSVFDEKRYFTSASESSVVSLKNISIGISICEDIWNPQPSRQLVQQGAQFIININASPFHINKHQQRVAVLRKRVNENHIPILYVNLIGGQDELIFDGASFVMDAQGIITQHCPAFEQGLFLAEFELQNQAVIPINRQTDAENSISTLSTVALAYQALVLGVRDYINKNGFQGVILGLSGGIDSALSLAIAVDAIGAERVEAVMMPFTYTAAMSIEDAQKQATTMGIEFKTIEIADAYNAFMNLLKNEFAGSQVDTTEQNIQARCRGVILMAISNKKHKLLLTTGNKSEMAVGYATLYGDMAGGYGVLKDVPKTLVYQLANYRNTLSAVIPQRVIERPPSAELAADQKDSDSLPEYDVLDKIIDLYVEQDFSLDAIVASTDIDRDIVQHTITLIDRNEYKRRQAAPGVRISQRAFSRDRRYPITSGF